MNPDPLRPADTDRAPLNPVRIPPSDDFQVGSPAIGILLAFALVVIVGVLVLWAAR